MIELVRKISEKYTADVYFYCGVMFPPDDNKFISMLLESKKQNNILLIIETPGGSADVSYRMARAIHRTYNTKSTDVRSRGKFFLYVHEDCKSAGTLLALAADEIIMSRQGELGPIDVQLRKDDEVGERTSGLTPHQALETLQIESGQHFQRFFRQLRFGVELGFSTKLSADVAAQMVIGLMGPVYAQLDPARLGEVERHVRVSSEYGERLKTDNVREGVIARLGAAYPSHEFVIDRTEARQLFNRIEKPSDELEELANALRALKAKVISSNESAILCLSAEDKNEEGDHDDEGDNEGEASRMGLDAADGSGGSGEGEEPDHGQIRSAPRRAARTNGGAEG